METQNKINQINSSGASKIKSIVSALALLLVPAAVSAQQRPDTTISTTIICGCGENKTEMLKSINSSKVKHSLIGFSLVHRGEGRIFIDNDTDIDDNTDNDTYRYEPCLEIWKLFYHIPGEKKEENSTDNKVKEDKNTRKHKKAREQN